MSPRGRPVVFDKKMADPREAITAEQGHEDEPWIFRDRTCEERDQCQRGANKVHLAVATQEMLMDVERPKLLKTV